MRRVAERVAAAPEALVRPVVGSSPRGPGARFTHVGEEIGKRFQDFVFHLDERCSLSRDQWGAGRHRGNDVAFPANLLLGEEPPVLDHSPVQHIGHVLMGENGEHAGNSRGGRRVDTHDPGVRVVGVAELGVQLSGQVEVGGVPPQRPSPSLSRQVG